VAEAAHPRNELCQFLFVLWNSGPYGKLDSHSLVFAYLDGHASDDLLRLRQLVTEGKSLISPRHGGSEAISPPGDHGSNANKKRDSDHERLLQVHAQLLEGPHADARTAGGPRWTTCSFLPIRVMMAT
jgi:hypothetical protein